MINTLSKQNIFFTALAQFQDIRSYLRDVNTFRAVKITTNVLYSSIQTGEARQSFDPWPPVQSRGEGAVIPCHYNIIIRTNTTEEVLNRDLTSVGTFDVFVPAHVAPRMSAAMLKESLSRPKYYKLIWGNSMLHVSNCHIFLIRRLILLFLISIY